MRTRHKDLEQPAPSLVVEHAVEQVEICYLLSFMGRHSILEKLDAELRQFPIRRESQVVYLLAEVRKVIEHERSDSPNCYEVLELFCNWALHSAISRKSNAERIRLFFQAFDLKPGMEIVDFLHSSFFNEMMQFAVFRCELESFLHNHELPCEVVHCYKSWSAFIYLYTAVVAEVPLQYAKGDLLPEEVEQLTLAHVPQQASQQKMVRWTLKLKSGEEKSAMTLYGVYRDERQMVIGLPDFFLEDGFQV